MPFTHWPVSGISSLTFRLVIMAAMSWMLSIGWTQPASALSEREEEAEASKLNTFINESIVYPAVHAQRDGQLERALALYERAAAEWQAQHYEYSWAKNAQRSGISGNQASECRVLTALGRFDAAAQLYLHLDQELVNNNPSMRRDFAMDAGRAYIKGKMYDQGKQVFEEVAKSGPIYYRYQAHVEISKLYETEGNPQKAEEELADLQKDLEYDTPGMARSIRTSLLELYERLGKTGEIVRMEALLNDKHCPKCGSDKNVLPIVYGLPTGPTEGVVQGDCLVGADSPRWFCTVDNLRF
jgi:tetratricopeptide (TPR) repeat protein